MEKQYRIEKDFLGEKEIELDKYYGVQTLRAKENFNITTLGISIFPNFIIS
ncbi:aspartate ammonia-lyase, partial [Aliarcobacter butzleri]|nr:aspartate ammonia-lyase [Aliarcobacter butzleri]